LRVAVSDPFTIHSLGKPTKQENREQIKILIIFVVRLKLETFVMTT
jgi:hypothetical protein